MKRITNKTYVAAALMVFGVVVPAVQGEPVSLRFNAHIDRTPIGIPFDSGIDFAVGDVVKGQFTFNPAEGDGSNPLETIEPYEFSLDINGTIVKLPEYRLRSWNDSGITHFPLARQVDDLQLAGGGLVDQDGMPFPNIMPAISGYTLSLLGPDTIFSQARVPASVDEWNALAFERQIILSLRDGLGGTKGFQATVGEFSLVCEPSAVNLSLSLVLSIAVAHTLYLRTSTPKESI